MPIGIYTFSQSFDSIQLYVVSSVFFILWNLRNTAPAIFSDIFDYEAWFMYNDFKINYTVIWLHFIRLGINLLIHLHYRSLVRIVYNCQIVFWRFIVILRNAVSSADKLSWYTRRINERREGLKRKTHVGLWKKIMTPNWYYEHKIRKQRNPIHNFYITK